MELQHREKVSTKVPTLRIIPQVTIETQVRERDFGTYLVNKVEFRVEFNLGPGMLKLGYKIEEASVFRIQVGGSGSETPKPKSEK